MSAVRYSGDYVLRCKVAEVSTARDGRDQIIVNVSLDGRHVFRSTIGLARGTVIDSPAAYDEAASCALSFAEAGLCDGTPDDQEPYAQASLLDEGRTYGTDDAGRSVFRRKADRWGDERCAVCGERVQEHADPCKVPGT